MKEKTFEELTKRRLMDLGIKSMGEKINVLSVQELLVEFGKQVREATIAECREAIRKEHKTYTPFEDRHYQLPLGEQLYNLNNLPTDRIKTDL